MRPGIYGRRDYPFARVYKAGRFALALKTPRPIGLRRVEARTALFSVTNGQDISPLPTKVIIACTGCR